MGHSISGFIARMETLAPFAAQHRLPEPIALDAPLAFLPLAADDLDALIPAHGPFHPEFRHLSSGLLDLLAALSQEAELAYIETDYFAGLGGQGAVLFRDGNAAYGPASAGIGPISEVLRLLGVRTRNGDTDEFETAGLGRRRSNEDWIDASRKDRDSGGAAP